ncbi:MAG: penicillin-binding protein 2 [candidate division WOR-3 bacterium]
MSKKNTNIARINILIVFSVVIFSLLAVSCILLQTTPLGKSYRSEGKNQAILSLTVEGERGIIYDRNGNPLTLNVPYLKVYKIKERMSSQTIKSLYKNANEHSEIYPQNISNPKPNLKVAVYKFKTEIIPRLGENGQEKEVFQKIVGDRFYPYGEILAPILGCIGEDEKPLGGLEYVLDKYIRGKPGKITYFRDALGNLIKLGDESDEDPERGKNFVTTINLPLQEFCYLALKKRISDVNASRGFVIVTDPQTGEILAMASYPSQDPNLKIPSKNIPVEDPYEPGSTFKLITYASALEHNLVTLAETISTDNGKFKIGNFVITDEHPEEKMSILDAFVFSSNIAAAKIALQLGPERLYKTASKFGFGVPTGILLPGESAPPLKKPSKWSNLLTANFGYGYGVMVNGVQMAMAYGAIANGGYLLMPRIIKSSKKTIVRKVLDKELCDTLKEMLYQVVEKGTGKKAKIQGIQICGKTGTAKTLDPKSGKYTSDAMVSSFIGFFPKDSPKYLIYIVIFEPKGPLYARFGGEVAAPLFREIAEFIIGGKDAFVRTCRRF